MLDTSDEFEFMFEKVIFTDLLLGDHQNSLTVQGLFDKEFTAKLMGLKKQFEQSMVFEPSEFELAKFHFI